MSAPPRPTYAGVGSRKLPPREAPRLTHVASVLERRGYTLRSGGAKGSDTAFAAGVARPEHAEIYLPCPGFNASRSPLHSISDAALELAERFHSSWSKVTPFGRLCHARNGYQVLGPDLCTPVKFVACWTPGGRMTGGTAQAMRIAYAYLIPVFNLADRDGLSRLADFVRSA